MELTILDNLMSSFCGIEALCEASNNGSLEKDGSVRMVALFDHVWMVCYR